MIFIGTHVTALFAVIVGFHCNLPNRRRRRSRLVSLALLIGVLLAGLLHLALAVPIDAQSAIAPQEQPLPNQFVDYTQFPTVTVRFNCERDPITSDKVELLENGQRQSPLAFTIAPFTPTTKVAILLDLFRESSGQLTPNAANVLVDLGDALVGLDATQIFTTDRHRLAVFIPDQDGLTPTSIISSVRWTFDINRLYNALDDEFEPDKGPVFRARLSQSAQTTALIALLTKSLDEFEPDPAGRQAIIVYSDGSDAISGSAANLAALVSKANAQQISIYTVPVSTAPDNAESSERLRQIAQETGGEMIAAQAVTATLRSLYERAGPFCTSTYRSHQAPPSSINVRTLISDGARNRLATTIPDLALSPPLITILSPTLGQVITKAIAADLVIDVSWRYSNYPQRNAKSITYILRGQGLDQDDRLREEVSATFPISNEIQDIHDAFIPVSAFPVGSYLVKVIVEDEFGVSGQQDQPFQIQEPLPTATPIPSPTPTLTPLPTPLPLTFWPKMWQWISNTVRSGTEIALFERFSFLTLLLCAIGLAIGLYYLLHRFYRSQRLPQQWEMYLSGRTKETYGAALVRIRKDPDAPPMLHMVPLVVNPANGKATEEDLKFALPELLYHPIHRHFHRSEAINSFTKAYKADLVLKQEHAELSRKSLNELRKEGEYDVKQEPINIQVAETATSIPLVSTDLDPTASYPLQDGDIIQFGETYYQFSKILHEQPQSD